MIHVQLLVTHKVKFTFGTDSLLMTHVPQRAKLGLILVRLTRHFNDYYCERPSLSSVCSRQFQLKVRQGSGQLRNQRTKCSSKQSKT